MIGFMTALLVILLQLCPRDQRAKDTQFQSTCILCRDSLKTQVFLCFLILSFLVTCICADDEIKDLQACLQELKGVLEKSDAMLYTPALHKIQDCEYMALKCYMLELDMVIEEEDIRNNKGQCFRHYFVTLENKAEGGCPACETYSLQNITIFMKELKKILEKINSQQDNHKP